MSDTQDLQQLMPEINAIDNAGIKKSSIPYEIYIYEAERLHTRASEDLPTLCSINMPSELLDRLLLRTNALRRAQLNWIELNNDKKIAKQEWQAAKPQFLKLHKDLIQNFQFAFRNDKSLLQQLNEINKGNSYANLSMNLNTLSVLGKDNKKLLEAINFDISLLDHAAEESDRMSKLRGKVEGRIYVQDEMQLIRNKAYTLLKECVDKVREYGKFAFRDHPEVKEAYASKYKRERMREYRKKLKLEKI